MQAIPPFWVCRLREVISCARGPPSYGRRELTRTALLGKRWATVYAPLALAYRTAFTAGPPFLRNTLDLHCAMHAGALPYDFTRFTALTELEVGRR